ncbi:flagellar basal body P-ring protein FlgI [Phycisphaera mikurensis]|uniref:Flagellar P-ring protein n=1 Tax=Phycisphaera mikurensis (strain NBRC 102666 / KCTC 22515 / FYK2301M01) TaxID=1142394 RepID=I0IAN0_PHYMF|nr:flagellar basal body P-ring protein FlgI [Phycisphaera mikurensis]MBB6441686.1 flagellar P-ring protein precursor FlgI [Phycisphaera mikurensis]BAM02318.1 flagellar P-ring protein [Phycisphaera mikurensis NBRC 102666]
MPTARAEPSRTSSWILVLLGLLAVAAGVPAAAVQVQDIARLRGAEGMPLLGVGLVVGLNGTGDKKLGPAHRMLKQMVAQLADDTAVLDDFDGTKSIALVHVHGRLPETGSAGGDLLDCYVDVAGTATSLVGGRLLVTPMKGPVAGDGGSGGGIFAFASGSLVVEDPEMPASARVGDGLHVVRDLTPAVLSADGTMELLLHEANASWPVAKNVAALVNGLGPLGQDLEIARAVSPQRVVVALPPGEAARPAAFIARVLESYLDPTQVTSGARVMINERARVIVVDHDVQFTPTVITVKGMTISRLVPPPDPLLAEPVIDRDNFIAMDPGRRADGARLQDLVDAFNTLDVPFEDQANVIKTLHALGNLHATLEVHR